MSALVVLCPFTCEVISTGIETEAPVLARLPDVQAAVHCPKCGERHFWTPADAMLADGRLSRDIRQSGNSR